MFRSSLPTRALLAAALLPCGLLASLTPGVATASEANPEDAGKAILSSMILDGTVHEIGQPFKVEISLANSSADWVEIGKAARLTPYLSLSKAGGKKARPKDADRYAGSRAEKLGPGGFVGVTLDATELFPDLSEPGQYALVFAPPVGGQQSLSFTVIEAYDESDDYWLTLESDAGTLSIDLDEKGAPNSVKYLVRLARLGKLDGASVPRLQAELAMRITPSAEGIPAAIPIEKTDSPLIAGTVILEPLANDRNSSNLVILLGPRASQLGAATVVGQVAGEIEVLDALSKRPTSGDSGTPPWEPVKPLSFGRVSVVTK